MKFYDGPKIPSHPENLHHDFGNYFIPQSDLYMDPIEHYRKYLEHLNEYLWTECCILSLNQSHAMILLSHVLGNCIVSLTYSFIDETWTDADHCYIYLLEDLLPHPARIRCTNYFDKNAQM